MMGARGVSFRSTRVVAQNRGIPDVKGEKIEGIAGSHDRHPLSGTFSMAASKDQGIGSQSVPLCCGLPSVLAVSLLRTFLSNDPPSLRVSIMGYVASSEWLRKY
ncbi:hypothetical protein OPV22_000846 [Ensete ventricosum]|uniref:Uncharacterized protein n=1 Tax=Ensete ventricosum TaxID=4639 RepID=A0AAV8RVR5_ENSVE|nr:hypothetical protein OPV22_000846 [Ensete ventricosum]